MTEFSHTEKYNALESQARSPVGDINTDLADALKRAYCTGAGCSSRSAEEDGGQGDREGRSPPAQHLHLVVEEDQGNQVQGGE